MADEETLLLLSIHENSPPLPLSLVAPSQISMVKPSYQLWPGRTLNALKALVAALLPRSGSEPVKLTSQAEFFP